MGRRIARLAAVCLGAGLALAACAETGSFDGEEYQKKGASKEEHAAAAQACEAKARSVAASMAESGTVHVTGRPVANTVYAVCMKDSGFYPR